MFGHAAAQLKIVGGESGTYSAQEREKTELTKRRTSLAKFHHEVDIVNDGRVTRGHVGRNKLQGVVTGRNQEGFAPD